MHTIQVLEEGINGLGAGFSRRKVFEYKGSLDKFSMKAFERTLKSINKKPLIAWGAASFMYGFIVRFLIG